MPERPVYRLDDLITFEAIQDMLSAHARVTGMQVTIVDAHDGRVLVGAGWQSICTRFHRVHPVTRERCRQSDAAFFIGAQEVKAHEYTCLNGLQHVGIPIIVDRIHLGTLFLGQFFYAHQGIDRDFFIRQGQEVGFDIQEYLQALDQVPIFSREHVRDILDYNLAFVSFISELAEKNKALKQEIKDRKATEDRRQKLENQLRKTQKLDAIGVLAGGVAHEFNNILQGIKGNIELWQRKVNPSDPDLKYLSSMDALTNRASDLVQGLLTFSRSQKAYELGPVDLHQVIADVVGHLTKTLPAAIEVRAELLAESSVVMGNSGQLRQMLMNVASNAVDALNEAGGEGRMTMTTENRPVEVEDQPQDLDHPAGHHVLIHVADTGPGMDQAIQNHLFEPFFTTKEVGTGTGLGLATAHGIVMAHQGRISCASVKGEGATFTLVFPVHEEKVPAGEEPEGIADHEPESFSGEGRLQRILFVDDEEVVLEVIKEWLEEIGFEVVTCQSGEEALRLFSSEKGAFDLVILDLGMPGLGGEGTLKALLEIDPQAKILVASGYQRHPLSEDPQRFGAAGFLGKPFKFEALHACLLNCLE